MRQRTTLEQHNLTGGANASREIKRRLAAEHDAAATRYGVPQRPGELDAAERKAWDALVIEYGDKLQVTDGTRLAELARVEVLLHRTLKAAKRGTIVGGRRNPAIAQAVQLSKMRELITSVFEKRVSAPPPKEIPPMERALRIIARAPEGSS